MRLVLFWLRRRQRNTFLKKLKSKQNVSQEILGTTPFFVSAFDTDTRSIIEEGIPSFESLLSILHEVKSRQGESTTSEIAVDVGANYGSYSVLFSRSFGKVISFEAHPTTFKVLELNVTQIRNIEVKAMAISSHQGTALMHEYRANHSGSASLEDLREMNKTPLRSYPVEKSTLDIQLQSIASSIGLIKIDVEGHELEVLQGAHKILSESKPTLIFEHNTGDKEVLDFLKNHGYITFYVPSSELIKAYANRFQLIEYLRKLRNPVIGMWKLYSNKFLVEFTVESLPKCELVLSFHKDRFPRGNHPIKDYNSIP